jgi:hypothetical protein
MPAETIHVMALASSGLLVREIGGPSVEALSTEWAFGIVHIKPGDISGVMFRITVINYIEGLVQFH